MYQRNMCPTMGALRRTLAADVAATSRSSSRAFSVSARRLDESGDAAPSAPAAAKPDSRKARAAAALNQITRLGANRRAQGGGLARGSFPSGQTAGQPARGPSRVRPDGALKITREATGPAGPSTGRPSTGRPSTGAPPPGGMVRAPARLKLSRAPGGPDGAGAPRGPRGPNNASVGARRGPNLAGRDQKSSGGGKRTGDDGPKRRQKNNDDGENETLNASDVKMETVLSDGMIMNLMRLQRTEWDRKPYEPKYAPGSFAANQLVHAGRELCRGESPPVKIWGDLERRIGVVGMHGAEARLKIRRVADLDDDRLGERRQHFETGDVEGKVVEVKAAGVTSANASAALAQAATTSAPAPKQSTVVQ